MASEWRMVWWKLSRHRIAVLSGAILLVMYVSIVICELLAPYDLDTRNTDFIYAPPQRIRIFDNGRLVTPFVLRLRLPARHEQSRTRLYEQRQAGADPFLLSWPRIPILGVVSGRFAFGLPGGRRAPVSRRYRSVGPRSVVANDIWCADIANRRSPRRCGQLYSGDSDRRDCRLLRRLDRHPDPARHRSHPILPAFAAMDGLSAILPVSWSPLLVYIGITFILGMIEWTHLARAVRSKLLALREEDFCTAAVLMGAKPARIIGRHLLPSFMSHLIASATLMSRA